MRPLKIAIVHTSDEGGGAEASSFSLLNSLNRLGHHTKLYVGSKRSNHQDVVEINRTKTIPGVLRAAKYFEDTYGWQYLYHPWFRNLHKLFDPQPDVVHFQSLWSGKLGYADVGGLPFLTKRYPSLMTLRDLWGLTGHCACPTIGCDRWKTGCGKCPDLTIAPAINADGTRFNWNRKKRNIQQSQLSITAVSDWLKSQVEISPIYQGKKIHRVYNGVNTEVYFPKSRQEMRKELNLPADEFIIMLAGQTVEGTDRKETGASVHAISALKASETNPFLLALGHSSERFLMEWNGKGVNIPFIKEPALLSKYYSAADVVLVTSFWETFGRIAAEAQMCGTPVVGYATGGIPEIVIHEQTGLLCESMNVQKLAQLIKLVSSDRNVRKSYESAAHKHAYEFFREELIAEQYLELYYHEIELRGKSTS